MTGLGTSALAETVHEIVDSSAAASVPGPAVKSPDAGVPPPSGYVPKPVPVMFQSMPDVALSVSSPLGWGGWLGAPSLAGSAYVGITAHHALRLNVARYGYSGGSPVAAVGGVLVLFAAGDGDETERSGTTTDVGIGWVWYPRCLWRGFTLEAGALMRMRDTRETYDNTRLETNTTSYGGRALVGWSWSITRHVFLAIATGTSVGHETGWETTTNGYPPMATTRAVSRVNVDGEGYFRIGITN